MCFGHARRSPLKRVRGCATHPTHVWDLCFFVAVFLWFHYGFQTAWMIHQQYAVKCKKKWHKTTFCNGVGWVDKPNVSDGLWICWVCNPTYLPYHFFMHSTIGVLSSARRFVILFFRMDIWMDILRWERVAGIVKCSIFHYRRNNTHSKNNIQTSSP